MSQPFTADQLEAIFLRAVGAGDTKGVDAALRLMTTVDPRRAARLYDNLKFALQSRVVISKNGVALP